jgi:hypothetical protein
MKDAIQIYCSRKTGQDYRTTFLLMPMGVLATGYAHAKPSARPPMDMRGKNLALMSAISPSNISPNHISKLSFKKNKNLKQAGLSRATLKIYSEFSSNFH